MKFLSLHISYFSSFVFIRFLGDEEFDLSGLIVRVRGDSVPQVKFFKSQECQQCEQLCKVTMLPTSRVSKISNLFGDYFVLLNVCQSMLSRSIEMEGNSGRRMSRMKQGGQDDAYVVHFYPWYI